MSVNIDFHKPWDAQKLTIKARAGSTIGAPLMLDVMDDLGRKQGEITIFTRSLELTERLAEAINGANEPLPSETVTAAGGIAVQLTEFPLVIDLGE